MTMRVDGRPWWDLFWLGLFGLVLLAWLGLYWMAMGLGLDVFGRPGIWAETLLALCLGTEASVAGFAAVWAMWAGMGVAMMLPTLVPTLTTHARFAERLEAPNAGRIGIVTGYLAVWLGFSVLAAVAQIALSQAGFLNDFGKASNLALQGGLLILAGVWQFSETKVTCQTVCLSPMSFFLGRFRPGLMGGTRMGLELGMYCLGCCWAIMALGFVGGVMNLAWMGLATLFMVLEKLPEVGHHLRRPAGVVLTGAGLAVLAAQFITIL